MKKKWMLFISVIVVFSVLFFAGCKDDDKTTEPSDTTFEILTAYMDENGMTFDELIGDWIISPEALSESIDDYYIMDIRSGDDFVDGHIPGAVASSYADIVTDAANSTRSPIVVVCYTGQSAGHAVMALRLSGYSEAKVLKWGMSGWHSDFDNWTAKCAQLDHANWIAAPGEIAETQTFSLPELDADSEAGAEILTERINALLTGGFKGVVAVNDDENGVLDVPTNYFINNYWAATDVETYGNISGAYRINPMVLENLDPSKTVVTYCWTGQTSSMITAYLTVLGYDAASLKFGSNCMIYDDLTGHKWTASMDYDYQTGE